MDRKYTIHSTIKSCEIRKVNVVKNSFEKDGKPIEYSYLELVCDEVDNDDNRIYLIDKNLENQKAYKRGDIVDFNIRIDVDEGFNGKTKILVTGFDKEGGS